MKRKLMSLVLAALLCLGLAVPATAVGDAELRDALNGTAKYVLDTVKNPQVGSIGGEWAVLGLARSGYDVPEKYYDDYYAAVETYVKACRGVLHEKKYSEYSRVTLALTAIGREPSDVAGYDLLAPLGDLEGVLRQGLSGPVWALIALDSASYAVPLRPTAATQATRQTYIDEILSRRLPDGGWSQSGKEPSDPDSTAMALQALARYQSQDAVREATDAALVCLSGLQQEDGGFVSYGLSTCESVAQVVVALCELGISLDDSRFVKNGVTLLNRLLSFRLADGSFEHTAGGGVNQMASEQGLYALAAARRQMKDESSLYRMDGCVLVPPLVSPGTTFSDVAELECRAAVEALAARGIVDGMGNGLFAPNDTMTRAQFAAIVTRGLGLAPREADAFSDVAAGKWYSGYIGAAYSRGLVEGRGGGIFDPEGAITRQEACALIARAASLCGMDAELSEAETAAALAGFADNGAIAPWARVPAAFCAKAGLLDFAGAELLPCEYILRGEMAGMLYGMLTAAGLV